MSVYKRGKVWWIDVKFAGKRHQESIGYDEKKAYAREAEVALLLRAGRVVEVLTRGVSSTKSNKGGKVTVARAFKVCWKIRWGGLPKVKPLESIRGPRDVPVLDRLGIWVKSKRIELLIGDIEIENLKTSDVADMLNTLRVKFKLADPTLRRHLSCLQTALGAAHDDGLTERVFSFKTLRNGLTESVGRKRVMTPEETTAALDYILHREQLNAKISVTYKTPILYAFFLTLFSLGSRVSETLAVRVKDLDLAGGTLLLRADTTKSRVGRTLPIGTLSEVLGPLAAGKGAEERIFGITKQTVGRLWKGIRGHLGISTDEDPEFVPHGIRHTVGSFLANNVPLPVAQQILGHAKVDTTMLYVHPTTENLRVAQSVLGSSIVLPRV